MKVQKRSAPHSRNLFAKPYPAQFAKISGFVRNLQTAIHGLVTNVPAIVIARTDGVAEHAKHFANLRV